MYRLTTARSPTGDLVPLGHGALIGRLWSADLRVNDPRVSEAHAMVSLRGRDVHLLALRGRFSIDGQSSSDLVLTAGMIVSLAPGIDLEFVDVQVPGAVLALEAPGLARQVLSGVTSLFGGPRPRLLSGWNATADDHVWPDGETWTRGTQSPATIEGGDTWEVGGVPFRAVMLLAEGTPATIGAPRPLTIVARWDTVHLVRADEPVVVISGHMAHAISQLATVGAALPWEELARLRWRDGDRDLLRHRWDMQVRRLRLKLGAHGLRADLLRADGTGLIELVLGPGDTVVDET